MTSEVHPRRGRPPERPSSGRRRIGDYTIGEPIAFGGMAAIHHGRLHGPGGFARTVAIKRLRHDLASDPKMSTMLVDEARLAARIQHPNVVATLDVLTDGDDLMLVLELVHGESLAELVELVERRAERVPVSIAAAIIASALRGVHAAHEARDELGRPLELVHRDLSPQNIMVDVDGRARVLDFGIAAARGRLTSTMTGEIKGKAGYTAPERIHGTTTRRSDIFSMGVVLWELLAGRRLFARTTQAATLAALMTPRVEKPRVHNDDVPTALEAVVLRSLKQRPEDRFATALEMADAIEAAAPCASATTVAAWLSVVARATLAARDRRISEMDRSAASDAEARRDPGPTGRRRWMTASVLVGAPLAIVLALVASRAPRAGGGGGPTASPRPTPPSASASAIDEPPAAEAAPSVAVSTEPPPSAAPGVRAIDRKPRASKNRSAAPKCDPPYTVDEKGHVDYRPECL